MLTGRQERPTAMEGKLNVTQALRPETRGGPSGFHQLLHIRFPRDALQNPTLGTMERKMDEQTTFLRNIQKVTEMIKLVIVEETDKYL